MLFISVNNSVELQINIYHMIALFVIDLCVGLGSGPLLLLSPPPGQVIKANARTNNITKGGHLALVSTVEEMASFQTFIQSEGLGPMNCVWHNKADATQEGVRRTSPEM